MKGKSDQFVYFESFGPAHRRYKFLIVHLLQAMPVYLTDHVLLARVQLAKYNSRGISMGVLRVLEHPSQP